MTYRSIVTIIIIFAALVSCVSARDDVDPAVFSNLVQKLSEGIGTEKLMALDEISNYYDTDFIPHLLTNLNNKSGDAVIRAIKTELIYYEEASLEPVIEEFKETRSIRKKMHLVDVLAGIDGEAIAIPLLEELSHNPPPQLKKKIENVIIGLGDKAVGRMVDGLLMDDIKETVEIHLYNTISLDGLRQELALRGRPLSDEEERQLRDLDIHRQARYMIQLLKSLVREDTEPPVIRKESVQDETTILGIVKEQLIVRKNPLLIISVGLIIFLILFIIVQLIFPKIFTAHTMEKKIAEIMNLIDQKEYDKAMRSVESMSFRNVSPMRLEEQKKELRSKILLGKAEDKLEHNEFTEAMEDYSAFCRIMNKDPAYFRDKINKKKIDFLLNRGWTHYSRRQTDDAAEDFKHILRDEFTHAEAHFALGLCRLLKEDHQEGLEELRLAQNYMKVSMPDIELYMAATYVKQNDFGSAIEILHKLVAEAESLLARFYFSRCAVELQTNLDMAEESLKLIIQTPNNLSLRGPNSLMDEKERVYDFQDPVTVEEVQNLPGASHWYLSILYRDVKGDEISAARHIDEAEKLGFSAD